MTQEQTVKGVPEGQYYYGTGRRKCAVARVRLYPGSGTLQINDRPYLNVFTRVTHQNKIQAPVRGC